MVNILTITLPLLGLWLTWILRAQSTRAREARKEQSELVLKFQEACKTLENEAINFISNPKLKEGSDAEAKRNLALENLKIHRLRDEVERRLYHEEIISNNEIWGDLYIEMSLKLSDLVDRDVAGLSELTVDEISEFLIANNDLIQASADTFRNKYHTTEIIWWEQALHRVLVYTLQKIRQSYSLIAPLKNRYFPKKTP